MKTKITIGTVLMLFLGLSTSFAQGSQEECMTKLSIFHEHVKAENFDAAHGPWMWTRENCPTFSRAIIADGEKILKHKIENSSGAEKVAFINDLVKMADESAVYFPSNYSK